MGVYAFHDDKSKCDLDDYLDKITDNDNSIQSIMGDIGNINDDIGDINGTIGNINDAIGDISGDVQALQNQVVGIEHGGTGATTARAARRALGLNYDVGDVIDTTFYGAGYVTGDGRNFVFEIPLSRVIDGDLFPINVEVAIRQNGNYIFGTPNSVDDVKSIATLTKIDGGIEVVLRPSSAPAHAVNNDACAVVCYVRLNVV